MQHQIGTTAQRIAAIAGRAHGIVTRRELLAAGITTEEIRQRLASGSLIREYPGVYRVGHRAPSLEADYMAAVRACGDGALLRRASAAHLFGLVRSRPVRIEVLTATKHRPAGLAILRARAIDSRDATTHRGIPVTTLQRTVADLAAVLSPGHLARVWHEACVRYRLTPAALEDVLARRPSSRGAGVLRRVVWGDALVTLSRLEERFLELLAGAGLPLPRTNRRVGRHWVDCRWPDHRLTVELDSYRYHSSRHAWEADRRREREAYARGDDFRRYTWGDVFERPDAVVAEVEPLLARRRAA